MSQQEIDQLVDQDYKYGFVTDIESDTLPPGLNEDVIRWAWDDDREIGNIGLLENAEVTSMPSKPHANSRWSAAAIASSNSLSQVARVLAASCE